MLLFHETLTHVEGSSKSHRNLNTVGAVGSEAKTTRRVGLKDTTDETDLDGLGPLSGSAIRTMYSGVFIIRIIRDIRLNPCSIVVVIIGKRQQSSLPARTTTTPPALFASAFSKE